MTDPNIEASSSGLKLSYLRFISDSAPGFAILLIIGFAFNGNPLPWAKDKEFKVLFAALAFLLATPVGLLINAVSYFFLGHVQTAINRICFLSRCWPIRDTRRSLMLSETTDHFGFTVNDWAERNDVYGELVATYRPDLTVRIEHLRGLKRFSRGISFLSFVWFFCSAPLTWGHAGIVILSVALWLTWIGFFSRREPRSESRSFARVCHELFFIILLAVAVLTCSAVCVGVNCVAVDVAPVWVGTLATALFGLLLAGMVDFYQRATIAMYLHIECPLDVRDSLTEIRDALCKSAKRLRAD